MKFLKNKTIAAFILGILMIPTYVLAQLTVPQGGTGQTAFTTDQIIYGDSTLRLNSEAAFTYDDSTNTLAVDNITLGNNNITPDNVLSTGQTDEYCLSYETTGDTWEWKDCSGAGGGDNITVDSVAVTDPDFASTGDIDFVDTSNTITANINAGSIIETDLDGDVAPADGDFLQYDSTGTNFTWRSAAETKTDLSLNNVENTALTTWTGSTALTTLGTIATGVWQATALTDTYVSDTITVGASGSVNDSALSANVSLLGTAIDTSEITDGTILEADLKAVDTAADEECLTYETTTGDFEWQACGAGGGDVTKVGTPVNNEIGVWTGDGTIEGDANLTYDGTYIYLNTGLRHAGDTDTEWFFGDDQQTIFAGGFEFFSITETVQDTIVINEDGQDADFRLESDLLTDAIAVAGDTGAVTLGALTAGVVKSDANGLLSSATVDTGDITNDTITHANIADADQASTACIYIEDPTADDDLNSIWANKTANDFLLTEIWAESDQTVNFDLQVDDGTPADVNGTDISPAAGEAEDTSLSGDTTVAAGEELDLAVTSVASTPTWVSICWTGNWVD